jgi:hypothetical protein
MRWVRGYDSTSPATTTSVRDYVRIQGYGLKDPTNVNGTYDMARRPQQAGTSGEGGGSVHVRAAGNEREVAAKRHAPL